MKIRNLTYRFPGSSTPFFDQVSFELKQPGINFLIGQNGAGKTTLADILTGLRPATGMAAVPKNALYLNQRLPMLTSIKVKDVAQLILGIEYGRRRLTVAQLHKWVDPATATYLKSIWQQRYGQLSEGQRKLVQLLLFLQIDRPLVVLDEPSAAIDRENIQRLFDVMRRHPQRTYLMITHDVRDIRNFEDYQVLWLHDHRLTTYDPVAFETTVSLPPFIRDFKVR